MPFFLLMCFMVVLLVMFPELATWLPETMREAPSCSAADLQVMRAEHGERKPENPLGSGYTSCCGPRSKTWAGGSLKSLGGSAGCGRA